MEFDNNKFKAIIVLIVALFLAIYLGNAAATAQMEAVGWVLGISGVVVMLAMGKDIWMLVPLSLMFSISFPSLPGSFSVSDIALSSFVGFSALLVVTRRFNPTFKITSTEILCFLVLMSVVQVYGRNPVGLNILGSSSVGARPYFTFALAFVSGALLASSTVAIGKFRTGVFLCLLGAFITTVINIAAYVPGLEYYAAAYLGAGTYSILSDPNAAFDPGMATRNTGALFLSQFLARMTVGWISPFRALVHPIWLPIMSIALAAGMYSGFRNTFANTCLIFAFAVYFWSGMRAVVVCAVLGMLCVAGLAVVNEIKPLPANVQRSLSFLPGTWEERYVLDAEDSTQWRIEIWIEVLTSDRWIKNKLLGDGLGFTKQELDLQENYRINKNNGLGGSGFDDHRESILINGDYHSGPVSFVRTVGYVGLAIFLVAVINQGRLAWHFIQRTKGTPWFRIACFFCIPMVVHPIFFIFVFGSFGGDSALFFLHAGLLRLMQRSFDKELSSGNLLAQVTSPI